jgi:hypothetical protein
VRTPLDEVWLLVGVNLVDSLVGDDTKTPDSVPR